MSRFKIGNKLIKIKMDHPMASVKLGEVVTVIPHPHGAKLFTIQTSTDWWTSREDYYELEAIYNSPLNEALK